MAYPTGQLEMEHRLLIVTNLRICSIFFARKSHSRLALLDQLGSAWFNHLKQIQKAHSPIRLHAIIAAKKGILFTNAQNQFLNAAVVEE